MIGFAQQTNGAKMFDLSREYTTKEGASVDIVWRTFRINAREPLRWVGVIHWDGHDSIQCYADDGRALYSEGSYTVPRFDLVHKPVHHVAYVAILDNGWASRRFDSERSAAENYPFRPIVKVEWNE